MAMNSLLSHIKCNLIHKLSEKGFKEKSVEEIEKCLDEVYESLEIKDSRFPNSSLCHIPNCCKEFLSMGDEVDSHLVGNFCNNQIYVGDMYCEYHERKLIDEDVDKITSQNPSNDSEKINSEYIYLEGEISEGCPYIVTNSFGINTLCGKEVFEPPFLCDEHKKILQASDEDF